MRRAACGAREDAAQGLGDTVRLDWAAMDAWYDEDEQVFVHPRNPCTRVDAARSSRSVRVELDGVVLAESPSPVLVFETGLPTRSYLPHPHVRFEHLVPSDTVTECPSRGTTSGCWSVQVGGATHEDLAWSYDVPTRQLLPITGTDQDRTGTTPPPPPLSTRTVGATAAPVRSTVGAVRRSPL